MTMRRIVSMVTSQGPTELARAWGCCCLVFAAGEGVGDLVHGVFRRAFGLVGAPFVLQAFVSAHCAGSFLCATFCFGDVLIGHESSCLPDRATSTIPGVGCRGSTRASRLRGHAYPRVPG